MTNRKIFSREGGDKNRCNKGARKTGMKNQGSTQDQYAYDPLEGSL